MYELSDVADWETLCSGAGTTFKNHSGPNAPHLFKFIRRSELSWEITQLRTQGSEVPETQDFDETITKHQNDVFLLTRHYMSSHKVLQITACCPWTTHGHMLPEQPEGSRPFRFMPRTVVNLTHSKCNMAIRQNLIKQSTYDFLTSWVDGTLPRETRPPRYEILTRNLDEIETSAPRRAPISYDGVSSVPNVIDIVVEDMGHALECVADGEADEVDDAPMLMLRER